MRGRVTLAVAVLALLTAVGCGARSAQSRYVYYPLPDQAANVPQELPGAPEADTAAATDDPAPEGYVDARPAVDRVSRDAPPPATSLAGLPRGAIGKIEIPKIAMSQPMFEGVGLDVLANGPGHWSGTAMPGDPGNAVIAGHRVTHTHPFTDLDLLAPGDQVIFTTGTGRFVYAVTKSFAVTPSDTWIANPTAEPTMTLFACHPKHQKTHRIVVVGALVSAQRNALRPAPPQHAPAPPPPAPAPAAPQAPPPAASTPPQPTPTTVPDDSCRQLICF